MIVDEGIVEEPEVEVVGGAVQYGNLARSRSCGGGDVGWDGGRTGAGGLLRWMPSPVHSV